MDIHALAHGQKKIVGDSDGNIFAFYRCNASKITVYHSYPNLHFPKPTNQN
jgi:hypothetical protein